MKFSVVIMNPPYQDANNKRSPLWQKFVKKAMELVKENGFVAAIHPCSWRKPDHELFDMFKSKKLKYLEIHNQQDGIKTFDCGTRYDWYILQNSKGSNKTVIVDENGIQKEIDISKRFFIPHAHSEVLEKCLAKNEEEKYEIIHSFSMYENRSPWISKTKSAKYKYPCVYATPCNKEPNLLYSCKKDGHFGIKKVIIGKASPENAFYDENGEYGVTNNCFGIRVDNKVQAMGIIKALSSDKFKEIIEACKWAGFAMEYKTFHYFKKDFWKEFI